MWAGVADLIFGVCVVVALWTMLHLLRNLEALSRFAKGVAALSRSELPAPRPFRGRSGLESSANQYVESFRRATEKRTLVAFDVEDRTGEVVNQLRGFSAWPRAVVGILILGSLLVTLFNLQISVAHLSSAFRGLSSTTESVPEAQGEDKVHRIQNAMGEIAGSARSAFQNSGIIISLAVLVLCLTLGVQHSATAGGRRFRGWAQEVYDEAFARQAARDPSEQIADLGRLISQMHEIVAAFQDMNTGLSSIAEFGLKVEESSQEIAQAVSRLPSNIKASVGELSGEVARHISEDLKNQLEYLKRIAAIYGDQELRLREVQKFLAQSVEQGRRAAEALEGMARLPGEMERLSTTLDGLASAGASLGDSVGQLDARVSAIPDIDLKRTSQELHQALSASLERLETKAFALAGQVAELDNRVRAIGSQDRERDESTAQVLFEVRSIGGEVQRLADLNRRPLWRRWLGTERKAEPGE